MNKIKNEPKNLTGSNDIIFKAIMLTYPDILKKLLETLMNKKINKFKILNSELPKRQFIEKGKRLDVYLETEQEYINVEVSTGYSDSIQNRNLSYICHIFCQATKKGEEYSEYKKSTIYNLIWNKNSDYAFRMGRITDQYGNIMSDMLTYNMVDMDKVMKSYYNKDNEFIKKNKYIIMLGLNLEKLDLLIEQTKGDKIIMRYKKALEEVLDDVEIIPFIDKETDERMLIKGLMHDIEKEKTKAIQQGLEQGKKEGIKQGIEQGKKSNQKEMVQKLISKGHSVEQIMDMFDLTEMEIQQYL